MNNKLLQFITKNTPGGGTKKNTNLLIVNSWCFLFFVFVHACTETKNEKTTVQR